MWAGPIDERATGNLSSIAILFICTNSLRSSLFVLRFAIKNIMVKKMIKDILSKCKTYKSIFFIHCTNAFTNIKIME